MIIEVSTQSRRGPAQIRRNLGTISPQPRAGSLCIALAQTLPWLGLHRGRVRDASGSRPGRPGHIRDSARTRPGHIRDASGTHPGLVQDASGTHPGRGMDASAQRMDAATYTRNEP